MGLIDNVNVNVGGNGSVIDTLSTYVTKVLKPNIINGKNILSQDIPQYIKANNILEIIIQSENPKEINNKIIFKCNLFGPTRESKNISLIQCTLNKKVRFNTKGPFYLKKNHFEKSFEIKIKDNLLHYTLEMMEDFYLGIFKKCRKKSKKAKKKYFYQFKIHYLNHIVL